MFPSKDTVSLFIDICNRDGFSNTISEILKAPMNPNYAAVLGYLKSVLRIIDNGMSDLQSDSFASGFLCAFHLFRLQIESEDMEIEDLQLTVNSLANYIEFLEDENLRIKNGESKDPNTKL